MKKKNLLLCFSAVLFSTESCNKDLSDDNDTEKLTIKKEEEHYRPNYHFSPQKNWMNDPNGMFYIDGEYHLFFQHHPYSNVWGPMHWGHAVSKDLVKWEEQSIALYPEQNSYIFSGCAIVDKNNTSGFGNGNNVPIVLIYTSHDPIKEKEGLIDVESQHLAYSLDNGFTWRKYEEGNPVIKNPGIRDFRDPKVVWDKVRKQWVMVVAVHDKTQLYKSKDLKKWEYLSDFGEKIGAHGGVWECPDFFEMKVDGTNERKWVLIQSLNPGGPSGGSGTQYFIGNFDGKNFVLETSFAQKLEKESAVWLDYGKDNYAGVTWDNIPEYDGRRLFIGWMTNWDYANQVPTTSWRGTMTLPREIKLVKKESDYSLIMKPIIELNNYISKTFEKEQIIGKGNIVLTKKEIDLTKAAISFSLTDLKQNIYQFTLSNEQGELLTFGINNNEKYLFVDRSKSGKINFSEKFVLPITKVMLNENQKEIQFKILLDKTSIELFYNDGEKTITETFFPTEPYTVFSVFSDENIQIDNLVVNELKF